VPYRSEDVRYRSEPAGITLAGTLTLPEGAGPFPTVVLISGSGPQNRDSELFGHRVFLVLADYLTRHGIAVLRSDDRGVGDSEGVFREATSRDFASDAAAAVGYLKTRADVRRGAVGLLGMSEGGLVAPMVASGPDSVAFVVLMAGPGVPGEDILYAQSALIARAMGASEEQISFNRRLQGELFAVLKAEADPTVRARRMEEVLRGQFADVPAAERAASGLTAEVEREWIDSQITAMGGPWYRYFLTHDPRPVLKEVRVPVLALNGSLDLQVPAGLNLPAVEAALREGGNPDVTIVELPGLNHLFQTASTGVPAEYPTIEETMSPVAMDIVARWILERTGR
jgi:pimeloyl-ACP methyl ester carboxylesterase